MEFPEFPEFPLARSQPLVCSPACLHRPTSVVCRACRSGLSGLLTIISPPVITHKGTGTVDCNWCNSTAPTEQTLAQANINC
jgi:hypothetical protein